MLDTDGLQLKNYIGVYENAISAELCQNLITEYAEACQENAPVVSEGKVTVRQNSWDAKLLLLNTETERKNNIDDDSPTTSLILAMYKLVDEYLYQRDLDLQNTISKKFSNGESEGVRFLRYDLGGHGAMHSDQSPATANYRILTCSINLNDNYGGGETLILRGDSQVKVRPKEGKVIIFPSNFLFPHAITPVTSGTRYQAITWFS